jgi:hypothetical protein
MFNNWLVLIITFGALILISASAYLSNYFAKYNIDEPAIAQKIISGLSVAEAFAMAIAPFLPITYASIAAKLFQYTLDAVNTAEALFAASALPADQRKATATSLITSKLSQAGVKQDSKIDKLISVSIDLMCTLLPKTNSVTPPETNPAEMATAPSST